MRYLRFVSCGAALAAALTAAFAQEGAPPTRGAILLLANDRVLEGEVVRVGDQYRIRRGSSETVVSRERVKRICADWDDALAYLRSQINLGDADERLRLARWCQLHGLRPQALAEAQKAFELRPGHAETKQLVEMLRRSAAAPVVAKAAPAPVKPVAAAPALDLSADALALFTTKVQPILLNVCARCHMGEDAGGFRLHAAVEGGTRLATQRNLAATIAQLDLERPAASSLLVKAVSAHGQAQQSPLRDRKAPAFQTLEHWATQVSVNNPHLRDPHLREPRLATPPAFGAGPATIAVAPPATPTPRGKDAQVISRTVGRAEESEAPPMRPPMTPPEVTAPVATTPVVTPPKKEERPRSADPFDPELFNRQR